MRKFYPISWFQYGGYLMPGMPVVGWFQDGGGTGMPAGMPSPREMEMQALAQQIFPRQAAAGSPLLRSPGEREKPKPAQPKVSMANSAPVGQWVRRREEVPVDPVAAVDNFGLPSAEEVRGEHVLKQMQEEWVQKRRQELAQQEQRQQLQDELVELGIPKGNARGYAIAGEEHIPENLQERLQKYRSELRLASLHPDFDPTRPAKDQLALNDDHSPRTVLLRGAKGLTNSGNATQDFAAEMLTGGGQGFVNFVFDTKKRYWDPIAQRGWSGVPEAVSNLGWDALNVGTAGGGGFTNKILNKVASRGLPEASLAMERQLVRSWRPPMGDMNEVKMGDADKAVLVGKYAGAARREGEGLVDDVVDDAAFSNKSVGPSGKLVAEGEEDILDKLDAGTLQEIKDTFLKHMPGAKDYLDGVFSNPKELKEFLSGLSQGIDKEFLKDKLQKLPLDELKNYFKGRRLNVGSPNVGGAPWDFGRKPMSGPFSAKDVEEKALLRDMLGENTDKVAAKTKMFDFLLNPVTAQRMGGVVPAMPMIGIRRGMR